MENKTLKVVCGFQNDVSSILREELKAAALQKGYDMVCISRYRKEGIRQYISEHKDFNIVVLQEALQAFSPYTAEDLAALTDERNINIIVSLNRNHYGNQFMKVLYAAGVTNAVFEEDAYAANIVSLILHGRCRKECREYYGIETLADVEKTLDIIDETRVQNYLDYIANGGPPDEIEKRYVFVAGMLKIVENMYLLRQMPPGVMDLLSKNEEFQSIRALEINRKRRFFPYTWEKIRTMITSKKIIQKEQATDLDKQEDSLPESPSSDLEHKDDVISEDNGKNEKEALLEEDISDLLGITEESMTSVTGSESDPEIIDTHPAFDIDLPTQKEPIEYYKDPGAKRDILLVREGDISNKREKVFIGMMVGMFSITIMVIVFCMCMLWWSKTEETVQPQSYEQSEQMKVEETDTIMQEESGTDDVAEQSEQETEEFSSDNQEETETEKQTEKAKKSDKKKKKKKSETDLETAVPES